METDAQKQEFLDQLMERIGVDIKIDEVLLNKAARYVAKLLLNSCWSVKEKAVHIFLQGKDRRET